MGDIFTFDEDLNVNHPQGRNNPGDTESMDIGDLSDDSSDGDDNAMQEDDLEDVQIDRYVITDTNMTGTQRVGCGDFELLRLVGKGSYGKVFQVRKKDTGQIYAMKVHERIE